MKKSEGQLIGFMIGLLSIGTEFGALAVGLTIIPFQLIGVLAAIVIVTFSVIINLFSCKSCWRDYNKLKEMGK